MSRVDSTGALKDPYANFIAVSRYARWRDEDGRRETWEETVDRYIGFFRRHLIKYGVEPTHPMFDDARQAILDLDVMPSMRALMTAGPALERNHLAAYNCAFVTIDDPRAFDEAMYVLMCGTGVGFSVEARHVTKLPVLPETFQSSPVILAVDDSKEGWAWAFRELLRQLWAGKVPSWDLSRIRPAGARLKVFGGRASGPAPLEALFEFTVMMFKRAAGRQLSSVNCHDLMCKIGDVVVSGGVRRSALISLSNLDDTHMAMAKQGHWWEFEPQRALANNSAVYHAKPGPVEFLEEWRGLIESKSGERGILNLAGAREHASARGRDGELIEGTNPCGEILLRSAQLCNLTEVVIRAEDTVADVSRKVILAAVLGTWQSTLTDFGYVRHEWVRNCEEERLLGVSLTGIYGHPEFNDPNDPALASRLQHLRTAAALANRQWADRLGINRSTAITCVKPSGTVSQLVGVSSGIHPWHSAQYRRTVRGNVTDPLSQLLIDYDVPSEPDVTKPETTRVFSFPISAPPGAVTRDQVSALDQLRLWSIYREHWTDHNPSVTITVRDDEWLAVGAWVYEHWTKVGGISFLPYSDHTYQQAPYQEITEQEYVKLASEFPSIRWADLGLYELLDGTNGSRELSCAADGSGCEVVDLTSVS